MALQFVGYPCASPQSPQQHVLFLKHNIGTGFCRNFWYGPANLSNRAWLDATQQVVLILPSVINCPSHNLRVSFIPHMNMRCPHWPCKTLIAYQNLSSSQLLYHNSNRIWVYIHTRVNNLLQILRCIISSNPGHNCRWHQEETMMYLGYNVMWREVPNICGSSHPQCACYMLSIDGFCHFWSLSLVPPFLHVLVISKAVILPITLWRMHSLTLITICWSLLKDLIS